VKALRLFVNREELKASVSEADMQRLIAGESIELLPAIPGVSYVLIDFDPSTAYRIEETSVAQLIAEEEANQ